MPCIGRPPCRFPRGSCADFCLTGEFLDHRLTHRKLLDLAGHGGGEVLYEPDVARDFVVRDPIPTELADTLLVDRDEGHSGPGGAVVPFRPKTHVVRAYRLNFFEITGDWFRYPIGIWLSH